MRKEELLTAPHPGDGYGEDRTGRYPPGNALRQNAGAAVRAVHQPENSAELRREMHVLQKELDAMRKRDGELSVLFKRRYADYVIGRVTAE